MGMVSSLSLRCKVCSSDTVEVSFLPSYKFLTAFTVTMSAGGGLGENKMTKVVGYA